MFCLSKHLVVCELLEGQRQANEMFNGAGWWTV